MRLVTWFFVVGFLSNQYELETNIIQFISIVGVSCIFLWADWYELTKHN